MKTKNLLKSIAMGLIISVGAFGLMACEAPAVADLPTMDEQRQEASAEMAAAPAQEQEQAPAQEQAQEQEPPQMGQPGQPEHAMGGAEVDDETLDEFADAFAEVQTIQGELAAQMQEAESAEEMRAIQEVAVEQIQERVESTGMAFQDYMMVAQQLERSPELQQRLQQRMQ